MHWGRWSLGPKVVGHEVVGHDVTGAKSLGHNVLGHDDLGHNDGYHYLRLLKNKQGMMMSPIFKRLSRCRKTKIATAKKPPIKEP